MRTFTDGDLTVQAFDSPIWAKERNLLQINVASSVTKIIVECNPFRAEYTPDEDGNVTVDMSDFVRAFAGGDITVSTLPTNDSVEIDFQNKGGLINPAKMIVPRGIYTDVINDMTDEPLNNPIWLPSVNLKTPFLYPEINRGEMFFAANDMINEVRVAETVTRSHIAPVTTYDPINNNELTQVKTSANYRHLDAHSVVSVERHFELWEIGEGGQKLAEYPIIEQSLQPCRQYACVQWVSRSGVIKRATWEVRKVTDNLDGSYEILRDDNAYDVRKGQQITLQLVLENLDAYDYWYYSDIVTSSDVRVMLFDDEYDETNDTIVDACRVEVTDKKVQQLDGNGDKFNTLKVNVNYKRYDTI